ncbi:hypothetical protein ACFV4I_10800 [Nocardiopsis alba]|uniref:DUF2127 domain-containing protein n=1 Tax=Nocardiopsis alba TaxID=53437 RepID=A0A7K2IS11_9ACTN|nr:MULTISPECIES: hypothetical protein [Nocardiopsis]MEC3895403.1 hypothetical protein [Nocardiopsis sp. LDBS1602]MYR32627.1 hypothetical protein [Nocardiopsis alba]
MNTSSLPRRGSSNDTVWTRRLQILVFVCSLVFTIGTTLQNFVIVDAAMLRHTMELAGLGPAEAAESVPGFLTGFRAVGCVFIVGNALGMFALWGRPWVYWWALAINAGQAAGVVMIPPEVFRASADLYGPAGLLPTLITDGGALVLLVVLLGFLLAYRTTWARRRPAHAPG